MRARSLVRFAALAIALAGCGKSKPSGPGARDALLAAWKTAGLDVGKFAPTTTPVSKDCTTGTVAKLDVLVCTFGSVDDAKKAADLGYQWVGDVTGSSQASGTLVIAVADRHRADPHGKTIEQIFDLASK